MRIYESKFNFWDCPVYMTLGKIMALILTVLSKACCHAASQMCASYILASRLFLVWLHLQQDGFCLGTVLGGKAIYKCWHQILLDFYIVESTILTEHPCQGQEQIWSLEDGEQSYHYDIPLFSTNQVFFFCRSLRSTTMFFAFFIHCVTNPPCHRVSTFSCPIRHVHFRCQAN